MTKTTATKSGYENSAWFFFCIGVIILLAMNSPAAAGGAFVAAGLCVLAEAVFEAAGKFAAHQAPVSGDSLRERVEQSDEGIPRDS